MSSARQGSFVALVTQRASSRDKNIFLKIRTKVAAATCTLLEENEAVTTMRLSASGWLLPVILTGFLRNVSAACCSCIINNTHVRCDGLGVRHVPTYVPDNTTELYFKSNYLSSVSGAEFQRFTNLKVLDLFTNSISELEPGALTQNPDHTTVGNYSLRWNARDRELRIRYVGDDDSTDSKWKAMEPLCNQVSSLVKESPGDWGSLEIVYLGNNNIDSIPRAFLWHLPNLKTFSVHSNNIKDLDRETFRHNPHLVDLDLSMNKISTIVSDTFAYLRSLKTLSLESNSLASLDKYIFEFNSKLTVLNLAFNRLETLHPDTFRNAGSLTELYLNNNRLRSVHEQLFRNTRNLMFLYLVGNKLRELPSGVFKELPNLAWVTFRENFLTELPNDLFANNHNLTHLDLRDNKLVSIPGESFSGTPRLRDLDVGRNLLTTLDLQRPLMELERLQLDGNPWRCDCRLRHLVQLLRDLVTTDVGPQKPTCYHPEACRGFDIRDVLSHDNLDFSGRADSCTSARRDILRSC